MVVLPATPFIRQLLYISRLNRICQALFTSFHKFLFIPLLFAAVATTACIYYHRSAPLSTPKSKFFYIFKRVLISFYARLRFKNVCIKHQVPTKSTYFRFGKATQRISNVRTRAILVQYRHSPRGH